MLHEPHTLVRLLGVELDPKACALIVYDALRQSADSTTFITEEDSFWDPSARRTRAGSPGQLNATHHEPARVSIKW